MIFIFIVMLGVSWFTVFYYESVLGDTPVIHEAHLGNGWYAQDKEQLVKNLDYFLSASKVYDVSLGSASIKAVIVPHAGHYFSGLCAAASYRLLLKQKDGAKNIKRVILLAPSHHKQAEGFVLPNYTAYKTVLGTVQVDQECLNYCQEKNFCSIDQDAHAREHSIEVQLPFLQHILPECTIVPLIIGSFHQEELEPAIKLFHKMIDEKTLIIATTDFTHQGSGYGYTPFTDHIVHRLRALDSRVAWSLMTKDRTLFLKTLEETGATICGKEPLAFLFAYLNQYHQAWAAQLACYYTSGHLEVARAAAPDTIQINDLFADLPDEKMKRTVSYVSMVFTDKAPENLALSSLFSGFEQRALLATARRVLVHEFLDKALEKKVSSELLRPFQTPLLQKSKGAFVTLTKDNHDLRGCIGRVIADEPLQETVMAMAKAAAFEDSRFSPVTQKELNGLSLSITILSQPWSINSLDDFIVGKHGIILKKAGRSALFLPQVATEQNWDKQTTLEHLCRKAGLIADDWKEGARFELFEGTEIKE